jgi:hypothetical protein
MLDASLVPLTGSALPRLEGQMIARATNTLALTKKLVQHAI